MVAVQCLRINLRMSCPECNYLFSEAFFPLDARIPHGNVPLTSQQSELVEKYQTRFRSEIPLIVLEDS